MAATRANQVGGSDYTSGSLREDLANFITLVSPDKTPHLSMIGTNKATNPRHEWQIDTLVDATGQGQVSGSFEFDTANNVSDTPDRLSNYTEVRGKTVHVEGSLLRSNPAGAKNWFQYASNKRKIELRRDIEAKHLQWYKLAGGANANIANLVYSTGNTRTMAGIHAFAGTVNRLGSVGIAQVAADGTSQALTSPAGTASSTLPFSANYGARAVIHTGNSAVTDVALTLEHMNSNFEALSENGGMIDTIQVPTRLKTGVSRILIAGNGGAAQRRADEMSAKINLGVDTIVTDFGFTVDVVPNYIMQRFAGDANSTIIGYASESLKRTILQPYDMEEDRRARYGKGSILFCEETLEVKDPTNLTVWLDVDAPAAS